MIPRYPRGCGMLKKLEKLNSVEGKIRKLRFTLPMTLNLGFSCIKSIFSANICDEYSKWPQKKLNSHKNFKNPCSRKKMPNWQFLKIKLRGTKIVAIFLKLPIWHFFSAAWIFKIFVAKQLLFRSFGIFIKHIG